MKKDKAKPAKEKAKRNLQPPSPLNDFFFTRQFEGMDSAAEALGIINAVLHNAGRPLMDSIESLECEKTIRGETRSSRGARLDVRAKENNHFVNLEVQIEPLQEVPDRLDFYGGKIRSLEMPAGSTYKDIPKVTLIAILNFEVRKNSPDFHQPFALFYEKGARERVTEKSDYHLIELPKFRKIEPDMRIPLHRWLYYLDKGYKDLEDKIMREGLEMDAALQSFARRFKANAADPKVQRAYLDYQMALWDEQNRLDTALAGERDKWQSVVADKDAKWQSVVADKDAEIARLLAQLGKINTD
jgi:predicted transposase/invertase (TIGR01784 family)